MCKHPQRRFTLQRYYIFFIRARYCTKKIAIYCLENAAELLLFRVLSYREILTKRTFFKLAVSGSSLGVLRVVAR